MGWIEKLKTVLFGETEQAKGTEVYHKAVENVTEEKPKKKAKKAVKAKATKTVKKVAKKAKTKKK